LYSIEAPETGGETLFADMFQAYDDLSDEMKSRIEGLKAIHFYGKGVAGREGEYGPSPLDTQEERDEDTGAYHLLARPHPVTGRIALFSPAGSSRGIVGMDDGEAKELLNELAEHALQPKYTYKHKWSVGDLEAHDCSSTMHAATVISAATGPKDTRFLYRVCTKGKPGIYA
jgi:taurine dioxygenase